MVEREPLLAVGCRRQAQGVHSLPEDLPEVGSRSQGGPERQAVGRRADLGIHSHIVLVVRMVRQAEEGSKAVALQQDSQQGAANMAVGYRDLGHRTPALLAHDLDDNQHDR